MKWFTLVLGVALSSAAIVLAQPPFGVWWLGAFALTPWLASARSMKTLVVSGACVGLLSGLVMGHWIRSGLQNIGSGQTEATVGLVIAATLVTGVPGALYGIGAFAARRTLPAVQGLVFGAWVFGIDRLRSASFWLPWSLLGHTQATAHGPAQLAVAGGVPLVSALLGAVGFSVAQAILHRQETLRVYWLPWLGAYLALVMAGMPVAESLRPAGDASTEALRVLLVQPRIPPGDRWSRTLQRTNVVLLGRRTLAAIEAEGMRPDVVFWPETSVTTPLEQAPDVQEELARWTSLAGAPLVFGGVSPGRTPALYRNSAIWMSAQGDVGDRFDKTLAVPFVEARPASWLAEQVQHLVGAGELPRLVEEGGEQRPLRGHIDLATLLCFEVVYPDLTSARIDGETELIINLANDSWYGSPVPGQQQLAFATFRAIEHRRYLLRVADSGPSAVVDPFGRIVRQLGPNEIGHLMAEVWPSAGPGRLERIGVLAVAILGAGFGTAVAIVLSWRRMKG